MEDLREKAKNLDILARQYKKSRMLCAKNRLSFRIILASKMEELRQKKSNAGIDTLELMLLGEGDEEVLKYYKDWQYHENNYKSLERIMDAIKESLHLEKKYLGVY